jgi:tRNA modification GTPase
MSDMLLMLSKILGDMRSLSETYHEGQVIKNGLSLCLVGPPNAGKSSLMNTLLGKEKSIVTDIPGTTRDILEDDLILNDLHFRIQDTAGIRRNLGGDRKRRDSKIKGRNGICRSCSFTL